MARSRFKTHVRCTSFSRMYKDFCLKCVENLKVLMTVLKTFSKRFEVFSFCFFLSLILSLASSTFCQAQPLHRFAGQTFEPVKFSNWLEAADVDGDGDVDFVSASFNIVSTIAGNGQSGFEVVAIEDLGSDSFINDMAIGDFNGDNKTDVVALDFGVNFLVNDGNGQFQLVGEYPANGNPDEFAVADFDGDSDLDLVLAYSFEKRIEIWSNDGNGVFAVTETFALSLSPKGIVTADINGDQTQDIAFADFNLDIVGVMYGDGDGSFADAIAIASGCDGPLSVALGDIDNDSDVDIVTGNFGATVSVIRNDGGGNFQSIGSFSCGGRPETVKLVDLDNDQFNEIIVSSVKTNSVLYNNRDGSFPTVVHKDQSRGGLAIADFDLDGDFDFSVPSGHLYINRGNGSLDTRNCIPLDGDITEMVTGDLNDDGLQDVAVADASLNAVLVFLANCDGDLQSPMLFYSGLQPTSLGIGDINGDGHLDLVTGNADGDEVHLLFNIGDGTFGKAIKHAVPGSGFSVTTGDIDSDGDLDVIVPCVDQIILLLNAGNGMLQTPNSIPAPNGAFEVVVGDITGDGVNEMITNGFAGTVSVFRLLGDIVYVDETIFQPQSDITRTSLIDIDNDGDLDLGLSYGTEFEVMLNNGDGTFDCSPIVDTGTLITRMTFGDVDGDQLSEAILIQPNGRVSVFANFGGGVFGDRVNYSVGEFPIALAAVDIDGDLQLDIVVLNHRQPWQGISLLIQNDGFSSDFGQPDSLEVFRGSNESGTIDDLFASDDSRLVLSPGFVLHNLEAPVWLVVESKVDNNINSLQMRMESNAGTPGLTHTIEAWNWITESYDVVNVLGETFNVDSVTTVDLDGGLNEYVREVCQRVRARVGWRATGFTINFPWQVRIDQIVWETE